MGFINSLRKLVRRVIHAGQRVSIYLMVFVYQYIKAFPDWKEESDNPGQATVSVNASVSNPNNPIPQPLSLTVGTSVNQAQGATNLNVNATKGANEIVNASASNTSNANTQPATSTVGTPVNQGQKTSNLDVNGTKWAKEVKSIILPTDQRHLPRYFIPYLAKVGQLTKSWCKELENANMRIPQLYSKQWLVDVLRRNKVSHPDFDGFYRLIEEDGAERNARWPTCIALINAVLVIASRYTGAFPTWMNEDHVPQRIPSMVSLPASTANTDNHAVQPTITFGPPLDPNQLQPKCLNWAEWADEVNKENSQCDNMQQPRHFILYFTKINHLTRRWCQQHHDAGIPVPELSTKSVLVSALRRNKIMHPDFVDFYRLIEEVGAESHERWPTCVVLISHVVKITVQYIKAFPDWMDESHVSQRISNKVIPPPSTTNVAIQQPPAAVINPPGTSATPISTITSNQSQVVANRSSTAPELSHWFAQLKALNLPLNQSHIPRKFIPFVMEVYKLTKLWCKQHKDCNIPVDHNTSKFVLISLLRCCRIRKAEFDEFYQLLGDANGLERWPTCLDLAKTFLKIGLDYCKANPNWKYDTGVVPAVSIFSSFAVTNGVYRVPSNDMDIDTASESDTDRESVAIQERCRQCCFPKNKTHTSDECWILRPELKQRGRNSGGGPIRKKVGLVVCSEPGCGAIHQPGQVCRLLKMKRRGHD
ncbi:hypothetical protein HDU76_002986 [Blyttiomyces sp. JEL0837]|nr:hypothetical protein HDU76_002986 [Blyttiomyces sp. JEL0837]